jgi:hypothetical protein
LKQVIFIGGTAYSGSTMLDMILANDPAGFSCGEVRYFFLPNSSFQATMGCGCQDPSCTIWQTLKLSGVQNFYKAIFEQFPTVQFIVDSSKDPFWIDAQSRQLARQGIRSKHLFIWKTPLESAASFKRRGQLAIWKKSWLSYHRLYATLIPNWQAVKYNDFVRSAEVRQKVCEYLEIPYFDGKEEYWQKQHHILFGNSNTLSHLQPSSEPNGASQVSDVPNKSKEHQTIYYRPVSDPDVEAYVKQIDGETQFFSKITYMLESLDVSNTDKPQCVDPVLKLSAFGVKARSFKRRLKLLMGKLARIRLFPPKCI